MYKIEINVDELVRKATPFERLHLPRAYVDAANATVFQIRDRWKGRITEVFVRPVPLTVNAVLYKRATPITLTAEVFIRDEASGGTPPAKYLQPEEEGGPRRRKGFERKLQRHPRARMFYVPGRSVPRDPYGNLPLSLYNRIFAQLEVAEDRAGFSANETAAGRKRRLRRQQRKGGGGSFFILAQNRGKLRAGVIYERTNNLEIGPEGARATSKVRAVLWPLNAAPTYTPRFKAVDIARSISRARFPKNFAFFLRQRLLGQR